MNKCTECGEPVNIKEGDVIPGVGAVSEGVASGSVCMECLKKGWSEATPQDFVNDPGLSVGYKSPIQRHDL